jgi:hypothetical protein
VFWFFFSCCCNFISEIPYSWLLLPADARIIIIEAAAAAAAAGKNLQQAPSPTDHSAI